MTQTNIGHSSCKSCIFIALSLKQRQFAWGMLAAYLVNLLIAAGLRVSFWGILGVPFTLLIYYD